MDNIISNILSKQKETTNHFELISCWNILKIYNFHILGIIHLHKNNFKTPLLTSNKFSNFLSFLDSTLMY